MLGILIQELSYILNGQDSCIEVHRSFGCVQTLR